MCRVCGSEAGALGLTFVIIKVYKVQPRSLPKHWLIGVYFFYFFFFIDYYCFIQHDFEMYGILNKGKVCFMLPHFIKKIKSLTMLLTQTNSKHNFYVVSQAAVIM